MICNAFAARNIGPLDEERIGALMAKEARGMRGGLWRKSYQTGPSEEYLTPLIAAAVDALDGGPMSLPDMACATRMGLPAARIVIGAMRQRGIVEPNKPKWTRGGPPLWSLTKNEAVDG